MPPAGQGASAVAVRNSNDSPPGLQEATQLATAKWEADLEDLFRHAKDRFPDVVWAPNAEDDDPEGLKEEVWGHKAIVYARAPPSFQNRYFKPSGPHAATSPLPYGAHSEAHLPSESAFSLDQSVMPHRTPSPPHQRLIDDDDDDDPDTTVARRSPSGAPDVQLGPSMLLRLTTNINAALFADELEYLYTGRSFGEAFNFLFENTSSTASARAGGSQEEQDAQRIDKLRKDLVFMWRSRLYADVRIALTGNFSSAHGGAGAGERESTTAIFSSHRFLLVSRSSYFKTALQTWSAPHKSPGALALSASRSTATTADSSLAHLPIAPASPEAPLLTLPSPPFTPASLHFTLGFLYTGTLVFSHRSYDLSTALALLSSAAYLGLTTLFHEAQARLVQEMLHGLFHAYLPFAAYETATAGRWAAGGCRCRQCARRVPRILAFALSPAGENALLERGARRALVGLFGEGWCTPEFARVLSAKMREVAVRGVGKRTTPGNVFSLLWAAEWGLEKVREAEGRGSLVTGVVNVGVAGGGGGGVGGGGPGTDGWTEVVRECLLQARKAIDECLARESEACFGSLTGLQDGRDYGNDDDNGYEDGQRANDGMEGTEGQAEWLELLERDAAGFDDAEKVEWVMAALLRGVKEKTAGVVYQTLVSSILLRPHPASPTSPLLPATSRLRKIVEGARIDLLKWMAKGGRWLMCRQEGAFDGLEGWAVKEIGDHLEVPIEDLYSPPSYSSPATSARNKLHPHSAGAASHGHSNAQHQQGGGGLGHAHAHGRHGLGHGHGHLRPMSAHPHTSKADAESDISSMRVSVLSRTVGGSSASVNMSVASSRRDRERERERGDGVSLRESVRASVRERERDRNGGARPPTVSLRGSGARSVHSVLSTASGSTIPAGTGSTRGGAGAGEGAGGMSPARRLASEVRAGRHGGVALDMKDRPDSKMTPSEVHLSRSATPERPSIVEPEHDGGLGMDESELDLDRDGSGDADVDEGEGEGEGGVGGGDEDDDLTARFSVGITTDEERSERGVNAGDENMEEDNDNEAAVSDVTPEASVNGDAEENGDKQQTPTKGKAPRSRRTAKSPSGRTPERVLDDGASGTSTHRIKKTLITRASLASVASTRSGLSASTTSRTGSGSGSVSVHSRSRTTSTADSLRSLSTVRKSTTSTYSPARMSMAASLSSGVASSIGSPRPVSRGSAVSTTPRSRLHVSTAGTARSPGTGDESRPTSRVSTISTNTDTGSYRTASAGGLSTPTTVRSRRTSTTSTISVRGGRSTTNSPVEQRARRVSGASVSSVASSTGARTARGGTPKRSAPVVPPTMDSSMLSPATAAAQKKPIRAVTVKTSASTSSLTATPPMPRKIVTSISAGASTGKKTLVTKKSGESLRSLSSLAMKAKSVPVAVPPVPKQPVVAIDEDTQTPVPEVTMSDVEEKENQIPVPAPPTESPSTNTTLPLKITRELISNSNSEHRKTSSSASSSSVATLRRKGSNDTIKTVKSSGLSAAQPDSSAKPIPSGRPDLQPHQQQTIAPKPAVASINKILASESPQGATLEIGIPCIISSKRKRFKAYARYIGEVAGETGPWVGVEVPMPMGDSWRDDRAPADDRQWNDGSWGGIRYFEMGHGGSEWEHGDVSVAARRRRMEMSSMSGSFWEREKGYLKREGDQLSIASDRMKRMRSVSPAVSDMSGTESRGLFVRPQQVLYVVDAVGSDL